jgi:tricorn protease
MHRLLVLLLATTAFANNAPMLFRQPTLSRTHIVFVHAGDLWSVAREGGEARRLTTGPGVETNPYFSPDGAQVAFTGEYDGNVDVFVVAATGGVPKRLTWHPSADFVLGWTPDGKRVLFASNRNSYVFFQELYTVGLDGGFPEKLPLPMGYEGAISPDGSRIAYVPMLRAFNFWKRYRGGRTTPVWIATLANSRVEKVPRDANSNDYAPMWAGDRVFFLSDRGGPVTLYSYDPRNKRVKQEIANTGLDLKSASAGPDAIVYEQFGAIHLYDLKTARTKPVGITLSGDMPEVREKLVNVSTRLRSPHISPTGVRALFQARGEILTVPAEKGDARVLSNSPGVMDRDAAWSPDGRTIAWFSDESGEYELHLRAHDGTGETRKLKLGDQPGFYFSPRWSPDSNKVAYVDSQQTIWYIDVNEQKPVRVDKDLFWQPGPGLAPVWSPDSKWLGYTRRLRNHLSAVFLYSVADGQSTQLTDGMSDAAFPVFDAEGKYLYFAASTDSGPALQPDIQSIGRGMTRSLYLAVLAKDQPSPFAPESDEEKVADPKAEPKPGEKAEEKPEEKKATPPPKPAAPPKVEVKVDFDNIGQRILAMPMPPRRYQGLQAGKAGVLLAIEFPQGATGATIHRHDLKARRSDVVISGVEFFEIANNGEKYLYRQGERWIIGTLRPMPPAGAPPTPPTPAGPPPPALRTESLEVRVDPRAEWRQMYKEVWRIQRDFFYDPGYHGLDLAAAEKKYAPWVEGLAARADLNYLFSEMLGELTVGHLGAGGGDLPEVKRVPAGLLGADYSLENGRYRFARVYSGENWNPEARAPLTQPGVNVVAGEYLISVNGRDVRSTDNIYSFFEATANKQVRLRVGADPTGAGARDVVVTPVPSEQRLRHLAWIEDNRRKVDQATGGRVAYVYMPDTATGGQANFNRYFYAQVGKEAAIIDERFNGGGLLATDIVETLNRKLMSKVATRSGLDEPQPQGAIFGPKVMIINEFAGSGGDAMPWYFKRAGTGKLIGKRTWGGLVGRAFAPELMDGGGVSSPSSGVYNPHTGQWEVENIGVAPDIEVEHDPELVRQGRDPQLEKAIEVAMEELKKTPAAPTKRPPYPNYHRRATGSP